MGIQGFIIGRVSGLVALGIYHGLTYFGGNQPSNMIPTDKKIEQGYVKPSRLEIKLEDIDKNGTNETLLIYDGKQYLLKLDEQGIPSVQSYEIQSPQILTK